MIEFTTTVMLYFCVYVHDGILLSPSSENLRNVGVNIEKKDDGTIHMTQPQLIKGIIKELNFKDNTKPMKIPAYSSVTLSAGTNNENHKSDWHYRRIIGKLNCLEN
jgi:hypothetical protein